MKFVDLPHCEVDNLMLKAKPFLQKRGFQFSLGQTKRETIIGTSLTTFWDRMPNGKISFRVFQRFIQTYMCISGIWTCFTWLWWFGFRLKSIFAQKYYLLQKWSEDNHLASLSLNPWHTLYLVLPCWSWVQAIFLLHKYHTHYKNLIEKSKLMNRQTNRIVVGIFSKVESKSVIHSVRVCVRMYASGKCQSCPI